ncbi:hypothetical protein GCM10010371_67370 [Streptomyces subrutilus]|uniref:Uncharacterized protein n=1 Tax=Streptomyces subrutilus TaxID=36818 RepID=A0A5P2UVN7_9ACTN|nr:hypothetical protein [Streptomyces subrutilus]QEU82285.1 hypothetical protein CP968_32025 [Streptomyces subrutilus]GGZ98158.1 hypothetical protein GCM10010371_67370 [Streptomyces subrutilus]
MKELQAPGVTLRSDRYARHPLVLVSEKGGVRYWGGRREDQVDRDFDVDVLWEKWAGPFTGTPLYGEFDPQNQRDAVNRLLCAHGMRHPAQVPGEGMLWLLRGDGVERTWPADIETTSPPICRPHAELALDRCPTLRRGYLAVRVHEVEYVGVRGLLYADGGPDGLETVYFTDPARLRFTLARYLVLRLRGARPDPDL